jgi:hypothetical protein
MNNLHAVNNLQFVFYTVTITDLSRRLNNANLLENMLPGAEYFVNNKGTLMVPEHFLT